MKSAESKEAGEQGAGSRGDGGRLDGACTPTNQERLRKTGLDTHVLLRFTVSEEGLLPLLPAPRPFASSVTEMVDDRQKKIQAHK